MLLEGALTQTKAPCGGSSRVEPATCSETTIVTQRVQVAVLISSLPKPLAGFLCHGFAA